jgi:ribosome recycling factor
MVIDGIHDGLNLKAFEADIIEEMQKPLAFLEKELAKIRTGRAHVSLVEDIRIMIYGSEYSPLKHISLITVPDSSTLIIQPFDISILSDIQNVLSSTEFNLNPKNDGKVLKISLPPMSQERRNEYKKLVGKKSEETAIQIRAVRQDYINAIKKAEKDKLVSQDFSQKLQKIVQSVYEKIIQQVDTMIDKKHVALDL